MTTSPPDALVTYPAEGPRYRNVSQDWRATAKAASRARAQQQPTDLVTALAAAKARYATGEF